MHLEMDRPGFGGRKPQGEDLATKGLRAVVYGHRTLVYRLRSGLTLAARCHLGRSSRAHRMPPLVLHLALLCRESCAATSGVHEGAT